LSEKFLAKARLNSFEDLLLGKIKIPRTDEDRDMEFEKGDKSRIAADMNDIG
jgi:hypothetical protein